MMPAKILHNLQSATARIVRGEELPRILNDLLTTTNKILHLLPQTPRRPQVQVPPGMHLLSDSMLQMTVLHSKMSEPERCSGLSFLTWKN